MRPSLALCLLFSVLMMSGKSTADDGGTLAQQIERAVDLLESSPADAVGVLTPLVGKAEPVEDYVTYFLAEAHRLAGDTAAARVGYERVLALDSPLIASRAAARLAPLLLAARETGALVALSNRFASASRSEEVAAIELATGKAFADSDATRAAEHLQRARHLAPASPAGSEAVSLLSDLRRTHPRLRPESPSALLKEARLARSAGDRALERKTLDEFLERYPADSHIADALLARSRLIASDEGRAEAAAWLADRAERQSDEAPAARLLHAAAVHLWNLDRTEAAQKTFERVITLNSGVEEEQRAHYALGRIHEAERRYTAAAAAYRGASHGRDAQVADESRWRAGWVSYLAQNFDGAARVFGNIAGSERGGGESSGRGAALYWQGRSLERANRETEAKGIYRILLSEYPDSYYAYLVEKRTGMHAAKPVVAPLGVGARSIPPPAARGLERARLLGRAQLSDYALAEASRSVTATAIEDRDLLLPELVRLGAYAKALQTALALFHRGRLSEEQLYPYLYPHAFADIVGREAQRFDIDPFLVYSLIRQESVFDHRAVSPAAAYGLMQLLLPTARRMAPAAGIRMVARSDLFRPEVNIRLGSAYLAELAKRFDGNQILMLAGYNAGESAAERWRERLSGFENDEFIEQISYRETREYVKKVLRNYRNYRRLYAGAGDATASKPFQ